MNEQTLKHLRTGLAAELKKTISDMESALVELRIRELRKSVTCQKCGEMGHALEKCGDMKVQKGETVPSARSVPDAPVKGAVLPETKEPKDASEKDTGAGGQIKAIRKAAMKMSKADVPMVKSAQFPDVADSDDLRGIRNEVGSVDRFAHEAALRRAGGKSPFNFTHGAVVPSGEHSTEIAHGTDATGRHFVSSQHEMGDPEAFLGSRQQVMVHPMYQSLKHGEDVTMSDETRAQYGTPSNGQWPRHAPVAKADVPMAKPPSGKAPDAPPSASKPKAPSMEKAEMGAQPKIKLPGMNLSAASDAARATAGKADFTPASAAGESKVQGAAGGALQSSAPQIPGKAPAPEAPKPQNAGKSGAIPGAAKL